MIKILIGILTGLLMALSFKLRHDLVTEQEYSKNLEKSIKTLEAITTTSIDLNGRMLGRLQILSKSYDATKSEEYSLDSLNSAYGLHIANITNIKFWK